MPDIELLPYTPADQSELARLANNKKIWDNLRDYFPHPYTEQDAANFIERTQKEQPQVTFGIRYGGALCGGIGLVPGTDIYRKGAELGYWVGEPFWGKGIASAAVALITDYAFTQLGFVRVHAGVLAHNPASMRILEKNGYVLEGIFKNAAFKNEVLEDELRFARLNG